MSTGELFYANKCLCQINAVAKWQLGVGISTTEPAFRQAVAGSSLLLTPGDSDPAELGWELAAS